MKIGFVSAILPELSLDELLKFAAESGFSSVELMCWPQGGADRLYAGVTHLDVTKRDSGSLNEARDLSARHGVAISGLGYYPNPLSGNRAESDASVAHLHLLIDAAADVGVNVVNSFIGRDPAAPSKPTGLGSWKCGSRS